MKLSKYFTLEEMTRSDIADRLNIYNYPTDEVIENLSHLLSDVMDPIRDHFSVPIYPSSGFRSLSLNRVLRSSDHSQHILGQAIDFRIVGWSNQYVVNWIRENLTYDQLILEYFEADNPMSGWIHLSYIGQEGDGKKNRKIAMTYDGKKYQYL